MIALLTKFKWKNATSVAMEYYRYSQTSVLIYSIHVHPLQQTINSIAVVSFVKLTEPRSASLSNLRSMQVVRHPF